MPALRLLLAVEAARTLGRDLKACRIRCFAAACTHAKRAVCDALQGGIDLCECLGAALKLGDVNVAQCVVRRLVTAIIERRRRGVGAAIQLPAIQWSRVLR